MTEREQSGDRMQLEQAIGHLEAQRASLGDAVVEAALAPLRDKLAALKTTEAIGQSLAGERKLVSIMFADISGFTPLSEKIDAEAVRDLINGCFGRLVPLIERYGGTVDKFMGDNIMALFGAPVAHENDPERALRAALEMMEALAEFNAENDVGLGLHFGINTGLVIAGGLGTRERQEYSVMGDAVNLAARLEDLSERGEILVGPDTKRLAAPLFDFEPLAPVLVKGKAQPVPVYRLLGLKAQPERVRGLELRGLRSPLVGRDAEVDAIHACLDRLRQGQGGIVSIIGEAGVGKSRLMAEIRDSVGTAPTEGASHRAGNLTWLEGRALSFGQTISYWPFQEILWQYAGIREEDSEVEAWAKLERAIHSLFGEETPEILPYLASLLSLVVGEEYERRVRYLDGEAMGRQIYLASRRFFERLAQAQPLVLVFEDLHWADESSALLLEHLLPLVERAPLLICGVSRPYRQVPAARLQAVARQDFADSYVEILLSPLSPADSSQLVRNLLEIEGLPGRVRERIVSKAGGNPFYLEEIIRSLIDVRAIVHDPSKGRWQATVEVEAITIPDTIQGVIMARVDRLDGEVKGVLRTASVMGRSFLYRVLRAVVEADRRLDQHLAELQAIELIREKRRLPELEYIFKHALAQEATYESILLQVRRELHARVGNAIEMLFADRLEEFYGLLAYHYARAEDWEQAQDFLLKAGDQAGRVAADAEALAHYEQAMAACARAFGQEWDPLQRAALERKIGDALFRRGEHDQALEHLRRALIYMGKPLPRSRWNVRLAILREILRQARHRLWLGWSTAPAGRPISLAEEEEFFAYDSIGWIAAFTDPEQYLLVVLRGLNDYEHRGDGYWNTVASVGMGIVLDLASIFGLAEMYHSRAQSYAGLTQNPEAVGRAGFGLTFHKLYLGESDAALKHGQASADLYAQIGDLRKWGMLTYYVAIAQCYKGDLCGALVHCHNLARLGHEGADRPVECWGLSTQGFVQQRLGLLDEALTALQAALQLAKAIPDQAFCISASADLGRCYLRQGNLEGALAALDTSLGFYAPYLGGDSYASLRNGLAEAYLFAAEQGGEVEEADWLRKARRACNDARKLGKAFRPSLPEAMRLQGTYEWLRGKPASAQKWWKRGLQLSIEMGQRYDEGKAHLEMGQRQSERVHLERAGAIFAEIGAERDLERCLKALEEVKAGQ